MSNTLFVLTFCTLNLIHDEERTILFQVSVYRQPLIELFDLVPQISGTKTKHHELILP